MPNSAQWAFDSTFPIPLGLFSLKNPDYLSSWYPAPTSRPGQDNDWSFAFNDT